MNQDYITTMDPDYGLRITDEHITSAVPFEEHGPDYLKWPDRIWKDKRQGIPNEDVDKNAYHILYLANLMRDEGRWIGNPLRLWDDGNYVQDGNHRYRAVKYLRANYDLKIEVLIDPNREPRQAR